MTDDTKAVWQPAKHAKQFSRLGWTGFWLQLVLIIVPVMLFIYLVFFAGSDSVQRRAAASTWATIFPAAA